MLSDFERSLRATLGVDAPVPTYWVTVPDIESSTKQLQNPIAAASPRAAALAAKRQLIALGREALWYYNVYDEDPRVGRFADVGLWHFDEEATGFVLSIRLHGMTTEDDE